MARLPELCGPYPDADSLDQEWRARVAALGGREAIAGRSVEGRPIRRFDLGPKDAPAVLLSALIHGAELIGSIALLDALPSLARLRARLVLLPIVNPDALAANCRRLAAGGVAYQRCNARGVDLNRNFPPLTHRRPLHPFAGSSLRWSPHYRGTHPLSEPETQCLAAVAAETRPALSLAFHSFGNLLLYPWAWTRAPHPRVARYRALGEIFARALPRTPYKVEPATQLYRIVGDLDDWLAATHGTLAFTVEVSGLDRRLLHPRRLLNPFCWMNPTRVEETVRNLSPAVAALAEAALALDPATGE